MKEQDLKKIRKFEERKEQKKRVECFRWSRRERIEEKSSGFKRRSHVAKSNMTTNLSQQGKRGNKHSLGR